MHRVWLQVVRVFYDVYDMMVPAADGTADKVTLRRNITSHHITSQNNMTRRLHLAHISLAQVFISQSFDPTSHFETAISDVLAMYTRMTGKELELTDGPAQ